MGHLPRKPVLGGVKQAPYSEQDTGQGMHCREILFTPRCSPRAREFQRVWWTFLYNYGASKLPNFRILAYFPHTKRLNAGDQPTVKALHRRMIPIFPCGSRRSKGVPSGSGVFLRLRVGEHSGPPNLPKFSPMANGYTHTECYYTARQIWTKRGLCRRAVYVRPSVRLSVRLGVCHVRIFCRNEQHIFSKKNSPPGSHTILVFIARQHTDARYCYSKSVCISVRPSVRYVPVSDENGLTYRHSFFTIR